MDKVNIDFDEYQTFLNSNLERKYKNWLQSLDSEIKFWKQWIEEKGGQWPDDFKDRLNPNTSFEDDGKYWSCTNFKKHLYNLQLDEINILDVGSGPLTDLPKQALNQKLNIECSDPLAYVYNYYLNKSNIIPIVQNNTVDCENLSLFYEKQFDVICCFNALDHSYDAISCIYQMIFLLKQNGFVALIHNDNEAVFENYCGLHQWNISEENNEAIVWNNTIKINLNKLFNNSVKIETTRIKRETQDLIAIFIFKTEEYDHATFLKDTNTSLTLKYKFNLEYIFDNIINSI